MKKLAIFDGYVGLQREFWGLDGDDVNVCGGRFERSPVVMVDFEESEEGCQDLIAQHGGGNETVVQVNGLWCMELTADGGFFSLLFLVEDLATLIDSWPRIEFCGG